MHSEETSIFIFICVVAGVLGSLIVYYVYSIIKANHLDIQRRKQFMVNELRIIEKERERIAQNLHDSAGPNLSVLKMNLEVLANKESAYRSDISSLIRHLDSIVADIREFSHEVMPVSLRRNGIAKALQELANKYAKPPLRIEVLVGDNLELGNDISVQIFRIVEEFIFNSLKYSQATKLVIRLQASDQEIDLLLRDNGVGFDYNKHKQLPSGLGLKGFEYRTEVLGGTFSYYSEPNQGVELKINIPL